jgi:thiol-disulfide isomerase/thioredoxin
VDVERLRQRALKAVRQASFAALLALAACGADAKPEAKAPPTTLARAETSRETLPFIHDDWARALAEGRKSGRLVFVDAWAPWCHSCQSMRAFVLTDPALAPMANDFVWLSIDTEKDANGSFVGRFANDVWPTLWVIDPAKEEAVMKWGGTATVPELEQLLASVRRAPGGAGAETTAAFLRANRAMASGDRGAAEKELRAALASATPDHPQRATAADMLTSLLSSRDAFAECAALAIEIGPGLGPGTSRASILSVGLACARDGKLEREKVLLADAVFRAIEDPDPRTLADDRAALYEELFETRKDAGDAADAKAIATRWAAFLDREAARAPTKEARTALDPDRLSAYLALGEPERAIPMLTTSERELPDDYNPPARLARVYLEQKKLDDAKAAIERAEARVYGPRAMRVFALAADIEKARGNKAGERAALEQALARS